MGLKNFQIILDNLPGKYFSNDQEISITGKVLIELNSDEEIKGVVLNFKGKSTVRWTESQGKHSVTYSSEEVYFRNKFFLFGSPTEKVTLPAGEHCYPFSALLPPNLPSSYEGAHGRVRYCVRVTIDRPWKIDHKCKLLLRVVSPLDLNNYPAASVPVKSTKEAYYGCCCCKSGPMSVVMSLPFTGFVPGDVIPLTVEIDNNSNVDVTKVVGKLRMIITYYAISPYKKQRQEKKKIDEITLGKVNKNGSKTWTSSFLIPPATPYYNLLRCCNIDLKYLLTVEAEASGMHLSSEVTVPLTIGTIPLSKHAEMSGHIAGNIPELTAPGWRIDALDTDMVVMTRGEFQGFNLGS